MTKIIKKVLMCEPRFYEVDYKINPWMKIGSTKKKEACKQWLELLGIYGELGIKVEMIEQKEGLPDMVFSADAGLVCKNKVFLSNFRFLQRRRERKAYKDWFLSKKFEICSLPDFCFFEGEGEAVNLEDKTLLGTGFRTNIRAVEYLQKLTGKKVVFLELINPYFYHLDTCLLVLDAETAFFYPAAFLKDSQRKLKKIFPNLIPLCQKDAYNFAANSIVTDHKVVIQSGNLGMLGELGRLGYTGIETDVSEFMKAGGGIHCLTAVLEEG